MIKNRERTYKIILLVNKIESIYGSVTKCPESDPDYQSLLAITETFKENSSAKGKENNLVKKKVKKHTEKERSIAVQLAMLGYNNSEIEKIIGISNQTIGNWTRPLVGRPPVFRDEVHSRNNTNKKIYFTGKKTIQRWCRTKGVSYQSLITNTHPKFKLKRKVIHWIDLPSESIYCTPEKVGLYRKTSINSYLEVHALDPLISGV